MPALEKNILVHRALQMVLLLHQVESLRVFVIGSIRATDQINRDRYAPYLPPGTKRPLETAFALLVKRDILTQGESDDLQGIIDFRNKVGHSIHELVTDLTAPELRAVSDVDFDYFANKRVEFYREKISVGMQKHFVLLVGFRELAFNPAEVAYKQELARLRRRINLQIKRRVAVAQLCIQADAGTLSQFFLAIRPARLNAALGIP